MDKGKWALCVFRCDPVAITARPIVCLAKNDYSEPNHKPVTRHIQIIGHTIRQLMWTLKIY